MRRNFFSLLGQRHGRLVVDDPRTLITERAMRDERFLGVVNLLDKANMEKFLAANGDYTPMSAADGIYYRDTRVPFMVADASSATITTAVCSPAATTNFAFLPANYFNVGKSIKHTQFAKMTPKLHVQLPGVELRRCER